MVALVRASEPLQAEAPSKASKTAEESVTAALPLLIAGCSVAVPEAGNHQIVGVQIPLRCGLGGLRFRSPPAE